MPISPSRYADADAAIGMDGGGSMYMFGDDYLAAWTGGSSDHYDGYGGSGPSGGGGFDSSGSLRPALPDGGAMGSSRPSPNDPGAPRSGDGSSGDLYGPGGRYMALS